MTSVLLLSLYFIALTAFLGLDIISKVPATLYALVLAALGTVAAVIVVAGFGVGGEGVAPGLSGWLRLGGIAAGAAGAGAGIAALGRMVRPFAQRDRQGRQPS